MWIKSREKFYFLYFFELIIYLVLCDEYQKMFKTKKNSEKNVTMIDENINGAKEKVTIGFLTSFREGAGKTIAGAIPLAVEYVNK